MYAVQDTAEVVPAEKIRAEDVAAAKGGPDLEVVDVVSLEAVRGDPRCREPCSEDDDEDDETRNGQPMAHEPSPGIGPLTPDFDLEATLVDEGCVTGRPDVGGNRPACTGECRLVALERAFSHSAGVVESTVLLERLDLNSSWWSPVPRNTSPTAAGAAPEEARP